MEKEKKSLKNLVENTLKEIKSKRESNLDLGTTREDYFFLIRYAKNHKELFSNVDFEQYNIIFSNIAIKKTTIQEPGYENFSVGKLIGEYKTFYENLISQPQ